MLRGSKCLGGGGLHRGGGSPKLFILLTCILVKRFVYLYVSLNNTDTGSNEPFKSINNENNSVPEQLDALIVH